VRRRIGQRAARATIKALERKVAELEGELEQQRSTWQQDYPGGTHVATVTFTEEAPPIVATRTSRRLGHAVVAVEVNKELRLYALPLAKAAR